MVFTTGTSTDIGKVRFYVGDTDTNDQILQDDAVQLALDSEGGGVLAGAAVAAEAIAAFYARKADKKVGSLSIAYSQLYDHYMALATRLRAKAATSAGAYAGGISVSDKESVEDDSDRVVPAFTVDMLDNPNVGNVSGLSEEES